MVQSFLFTHKKYAYLGMSLFTLGIGTFAFGADGLAVSADKLTGSLASFAKLVTGLSYVLGLILSVLSLLKLKAHKDNPQQNPLSSGIILLFVGVALVYLPSLLSTTGESVGFSKEGKIGGFDTLGNAGP